MRIALLAFAILFTTSAHASHYPLGGAIESEMRSFDPKKYVPGDVYSFVKYMMEQQELHDVGLHFDDFEIMLFDLPVPPDPQSKKAPQ